MTGKSIRTPVRGAGDKEPLLLQHGRDSRLRLRPGGGHPHDLGRRERGGSPAYYRGTFSDEGDPLSGAWHYPGGGGYGAISTRVG
jgi:hypothetical protein